MRPIHPEPTGLTSCPADILYSIFELLSPAEFHALCLVHKSVCGMAARLLYQNIQMVWERENPFDPPPVTKLLRTLVSSPDLAAHVRTFHLGGEITSYASLVRTIRAVPIFPTELNASISFIQTTGVPYSDLWKQDLQQGKLDAVVALLLAQLPNLKSLHLGPAFTKQSEIIGMVLRSAIFETVDYGLPDFRHLRDVTYLLHEGHDQARDKNVKNTADVLPFFYLSNIERISVFLESPLAITWPQPTLPVPSSLTSLVLNSVRENYLMNLLSITPYLKSLRWTWFYDNGLLDAVNLAIIDLDQIGDAISCLKNTLTDLTIIGEIELGGNDINLPGVKTDGSLTAMVTMDTLKALQVPWAFLVGFALDRTKRLQDVLPRKLEHLTITYDLCIQNSEHMEPYWPEFEWDDHAILDVLKSWLEDRTFTPNLCGVSLGLVRYETDEYDWEPEMRHQLAELGAQAGVVFDIIFTDEM
ncbi:uncharacterized protein N7515_005452 [Penicillium bovifimosum]|uniref:F-box domain-containing protein n=1 Tax=Penicillium bovifimosum TaxID=126998 RepID=A0A9W9GT65_9EURO|nr:uncharacterized protein N7515_005452 [Penicillium bovifimosum]KAJ5129413.1 hypothetical protein N7515_005452 [Penicillium bovifimosum]